MNNLRDIRLPLDKHYGAHFDSKQTSNVNIASVANNILLQGLEQFSFETFIRLTSTVQTQFARILEFSGTNLGLKIQLNSTSTNVVAATVGNGITSAAVVSTFGLRTDQFRHLEVDWDGHFVRMFLNGLQTGGDVALEGGNWGNPNKSLSLGNSTTGTRSMGAVMQEARLSSVSRHTASFAPPTEPHVTDDDTIALWHMTDKDPSTLVDSSGNGLHLILAGSPKPQTRYYPGYF